MPNIRIFGINNVRVQKMGEASRRYKDQHMTTFIVRKLVGIGRHELVIVSTDRQIMSADSECQIVIADGDRRS